jgi:N-acetyl-alpha-D-glucosaminyl L-malate synthase BshA
MTLGGAGVYASNLCRELAYLGHEVHVISPSLKRKIIQTSRNLIVHSIPVLNRHFLKTFSFWLRIRRFYKVLQQNVDFDILHINVTSGLSLTPHLVKIPRIVTIHHLAKTVFQITKNSPFQIFEDLEGETGLASRIEKTFIDFDKVEIDRADKVVAVSNFVKNSIISTYKVPESKVETIYNGVSWKEYFCTQSEIEEVKRTYKLSNEPTILYVGRLEKRKNLESLIKAFKLVVERTKCKLVITGSGKQSSLREITFSLGINKHVIFTGLVEDNILKQLYNACNVFVLPSHMEGFGLTLLEAMAAAKPVVASNVGGIPELVKNGINGILANTNNTKELATALTFLLDNPELAKNMGLQNREYVAKNFSWEKTAKMTSELYERILGRSTIKKRSPMT